MLLPQTPVAQDGFFRGVKSTERHQNNYSQATYKFLSGFLTSSSQRFCQEPQPERTVPVNYTGSLWNFDEFDFMPRGLTP